MTNIKYKLMSIQLDYVDAFKMDCSKEDLRTNPDAKKMAKYLNRQARRIDKMVQLCRKIMCEN